MSSVGTFDEAILVGIFDAQQKFAAVGSGKQVGVKAASKVADMHIARGRRGKTGCETDIMILLCLIV